MHEGAGSPSCSAICLVAQTLGDLLHNGQACNGAASVHVLACASDDRLRAACIAHGIRFHQLDDFPASAQTTLDGPHLIPLLHDSDRVRQALEQLHAAYSFDVIKSVRDGGLVFRSVQAKQSGQAFGDVTLLIDDGHSAKPHARACLPRDLTVGHMEQYARQYADAMTIGSQTLGAAGSGAAPLVSVCVPYFNLGAFLEATLDSLAQQTYSNLEVLVINDGSADASSIEVFRRMQAKFPRFRYLEQENAGIGATRNRGLAEARGKYFLPVDADNVARPEMVERFVRGMEHNPTVAALTCYFLAFHDDADLVAGRFAYAYKPVGGPRILGALQNVYGDGNAIFRTDVLRAVGGFETDRDTSFEDWEVFVKLVNAGQRVDVVPDFLFSYRHRADGFSRATDLERNHQRVLRRFVEMETLPPDDRQTLWNLLAGQQERIAELENENRALRQRLQARRYRFVDRLKHMVTWSATS
jgi:glycosyltransferase involved in cell wall biosynthesis